MNRSTAVNGNLEWSIGESALELRFLGFELAHPAVRQLYRYSHQLEMGVVPMLRIGKRADGCHVSATGHECATGWRHDTGVR